MDSSFWIKPGLLMFRGKAFDARAHSHHAIQIVIPDTGASLSCHFENATINESVVIASAVRHELHMSCGWIILVEPQSHHGRELITFLYSQAYKPIDVPSIHEAFTCEDLSSGQAPDLDILFSFLRAENCEDTMEVRQEGIFDPRLQKLLSQLDACFLGECVKPSHWRASEIASGLALSESRFLHLFREQMGVAWRPYLLWRRLICAVQAMQRGASATEAAHKAGFSDSAHLSRNFRRTFGMNIREATRLFSQR